MTAPGTTRGRCLCRHVAYEFEGEPNWRAHCHCESCRRNCSAAFATFFGVDNGKWRWTGLAPAVYESSPGVARLFCPRCGTPMAYRSVKFAHETHFYAASLEDHRSFRVGGHVHAGEMVAWADIHDGTKRT